MSDSSLKSPIPTLALCKLRAYFWAVHELKGRGASGFSYDDTNGAGITVENAQIWEDYIKVRCVISAVVYVLCSYVVSEP